MNHVYESCALGAFALIAGSAFLFTSYAKDAFPPITLTLLRLAGGSLGLFLASVANDRLSNARLASRAELRSLALIGFFNTSVPYTLFAAALGEGMGVGITAALTSSGPIFAFIFSICVSGNAFRTHLNRQHLGGLGIGFVGIILLALYKQYAIKQKGTNIIPLVLLVTGQSSKAFAAVLAQRHNQQFGSNISALTQALVQATAGMVLACLLSLSLDCSHYTPAALDKLGLTKGRCYDIFQHVPSRAWLSVTYLAICSSCIVYVLQFFLVKRVGAVRQMSVDYLTPVVGVVEGAVFRQEWAAISVQQVILFLAGTCLSFSGVAILQWAGHPPNQSAASHQSLLNAKPTDSAPDVVRSVSVFAGQGRARSVGTDQGGSGEA